MEPNEMTGAMRRTLRNVVEGTALPPDSPYTIKYDGLGGHRMKRRHYVGTSGCTWCKNGDLADDCPPSGAEMRKLFNELRELVADLRRVHELQEKE